MQYTKYLRWVILGLLTLIIVVVPFIIGDGKIFPDLFFPYITGKNFVFRILVEVIGGCFVLLALAEPKYRPRTSLLMWGLLAFVVWMGIATLLSVDPAKSFWSNFERMEGYIGLLHIYVFCIVFASIVDTEKWWENIFRISVGASAAQGLVAFMQVTHLLGFAPSSQSGARADGTFGNATYLAVYMLFNVFLTLFLLLRINKRQPTSIILYSVALVLQLLALFYTETRGALLGLVVGLIVTAVWIAWRGKNTHEWILLRKISLWVIVSIGVLAAVFIVLRNTPAIQHVPTLQRFASISLTDRTTQSRFLIWHMALQGASERPLQGWGQENFNFVFNKYYVPQMYDQEQWFDRAHNAFLDWLVAGGIPAFLLYLSLFVLTCLSIVRSSRNIPEQGILLGAVIAYAFNNLFVFDNLVSYIYFALILAYTHGLIQKKPHAMLVMSKPITKEVMAIAVPLVFIGTALCIWSANVPAITRAQSLLSAVVPYNLVQTPQGTQNVAKDPSTVLSEFDQAFKNSSWPGTSMGQQETVEQLLQYASNSVAPSTTIAPDVKQHFYITSHDDAVALLSKRPHDARLELFMGTFLGAFGQTVEAQKYLNMALGDSPKKQAILFELGVSEINGGEAQKAVTHFKQAFEEAPEYKDAGIFYAAGLYYAGLQQEGDVFLTKEFGSVLIDDPRLLQVYTQKKMYDRVIAIWQQKIAVNPGDSQLHISLASAYFSAGDIKKTISELQKAAELNPAMASQIQTAINSIQNGTVKPQ